MRASAVGAIALLLAGFVVGCSDEEPENQEPQSSLACGAIEKALLEEALGTADLDIRGDLDLSSGSDESGECVVNDGGESVMTIQASRIVPSERPELLKSLRDKRAKLTGFCEDEGGEAKFIEDWAYTCVSDNFISLTAYTSNLSVSLGSSYEAQPVTDGQVLEIAQMLDEKFADSDGPGDGELH